MHPDTDQEEEPPSRPRLAVRLKELREIAGQTQAPVARYLDCQVPMISAYEKGRYIPTREKIRLYAEHFREPGRSRDDLESELLRLMVEAEDEKRRVSSSVDQKRKSFWHFPTGSNVTIVCGELPPKMRARYAQPIVPDYVRGYRYADLDTVIALWGFVPSINPTSRVEIITSTEYDPTKHDADELIIVGGIDFNTVTKRILSEIRCPIRQQHFPSFRSPKDSDARSDMDRDVEGPERAAFMVPKEGGEGEEGKGLEVSHEPTLEKNDENQWELIQDIGLIIRGPNPFNTSAATLTLFNGMYGRGVLGSALALTHMQLRERNIRYLTKRGCERRTVAVLFTVGIMNEKPSPPDLTNPEVRLYEWAGPVLTD